MPSPLLLLVATGPRDHRCLISPKVSTFQSASGLMGIMFLISALFFGQDKQWKTDTETPKIVKAIINSRWFAGLVLPLGPMVMVIGTWIFLYQLTNSVAAVLALVGVQLLVVGYCYIQYRKALAANPAPAPVAS
jgi:vacuolar-type H+-ATPase subunit I/STV1